MALSADKVSPTAAILFDDRDAALERCREDRKATGFAGRLAPRHLTLAALVALLVLRMPWSAVHMDLAHSLFIASRILHGEFFPWHGQILAGTIHLGPAYYWLLALLLALGRGWLGAVLLLGLIAALQVPLAYLLGKELHSRRAGLFWALGLIVPSWSTIEWTFPGHNLLTAPLVLAFLLCAVRYWQRARLGYLVGMALAFVLGLHAHPTCAGLVWIGAAVVIRTWHRQRIPPRDLVIAALIGVLPLLPYFAWDAAHGFADIAAASAYLHNPADTGHVSMMAPILHATAFGGTHYWFATLLDWPPGVTTAASLILTLCGLCGLAGFLFPIFAPPPRRGVVMACLAATFGILLTTALIRNITPYYMTTVLRVALAGIVAIGFAALGDARFARILRTCIAGVVVISALLCQVASARLETQGRWPFGIVPLFDVTAEPSATQPLPLMPAYAMAGSGNFLCAEYLAAVHGALARHVLYDYALDMRLACGRADAMIGGADPRRSHWLGLSRALFKRIGVDPEHRLGPLGIVRARPLTTHSIDPPAAPVYPAYSARSGKNTRHAFHLKLGANEHLVISTLAYFVAEPRVDVTVSGRAMHPIAEDAISRVFACGACAGKAGQDVDVTVTTTDYPDLDIVVF